MSQQVERTSRQPDSNRLMYPQLRQLIAPRISRARESPLSNPQHLVATRHIERLPISAAEIHSQAVLQHREQVLRVLLCGTRQYQTHDTDHKCCPLHLLRNHETTLIPLIVSFLHVPLDHVKWTIPAPLVGQSPWGDPLVFVQGRANSHWQQRALHESGNLSTPPGRYPNPTFDQNSVSFVTCATNVEFPPPNNRNVNMMPFIFGDQESLPDDLQCYFSLIEKCPYMREEVGKVGYLTIHESWVDGTQAQRRRGLHIESPGVFSDTDVNTKFEAAVEHPWGMGMFRGPDQYEGGIYMASSVADTSCLWDALVNKNAPGVVDRHGGCEYLRPYLGPGTCLKAGELVWMTDCTPHEALPQAESGTRQFFRVVSPYVSHWFADHSTVNPKVPLPEHVKVINGSKFETS